mmetsp:Transcript_13425/g.20730  ORF Transcript_13425/g.20730 Transcript_13425/m.20730 type:complete len:80 (+) Transcript_13425:584-823(+)
MTGQLARFVGSEIGTSTSSAFSFLSIEFSACVSCHVGELHHHHVFGDTDGSIVCAPLKCVAFAWSSVESIAVYRGNSST